MAARNSSVQEKANTDPILEPPAFSSFDEKKDEMWIDKLMQR